METEVSRAEISILIMIRDMNPLPRKLPKPGEKLTSAQLRKKGLMHPDHQYAKARNKWEIIAINLQEKRMLGKMRRRHLVVTVSGTPPTKTGKKRKRPIKVRLLRRLS